MPLFLFEDHWTIARRKVQPVFGFMCTLDIMGYSSEMLFTIPFLVLQKAQEKVQNDPKEINFKILHLVEQTCMNLIEQSHTFRNDMIQKIVDFAYQKPKVSSRTTDLIKSIEVLSIQFVCLLKVKDLKCDNEELLQHFEGEKLSELKKTFVRYATEELLRRQINQGDSLSQDDA